MALLVHRESQSPTFTSNSGSVDSDNEDEFKDADDDLPQARDIIDAMEYGDKEVLHKFYTGHTPLEVKCHVVSECLDGIQNAADFRVFFDNKPTDYFTDQQLLLEFVRKALKAEDVQLQKSLSSFIIKLMNTKCMSLIECKDLLKKRLAIGTGEIARGVDYQHPVNVMENHTNGTLKLTDAFYVDLFKTAVITPGQVLKNLIDYGCDHPTNLTMTLVISMIKENFLSVAKFKDPKIAPDGMLNTLVFNRVTIPYTQNFPIEFFEKIYRNLPDVLNLEDILHESMCLYCNSNQWNRMIDFLLGVYRLENESKTWTKIDVVLLVMFLNDMLSECSCLAERKERVLEMIDFIMTKRIGRKITNQELKKVIAGYENSDNIMILAYFHPYVTCGDKIFDVIKAAVDLRDYDLVLVISILPDGLYPADPPATKLDQLILPRLLRFTTKREFSKIFKYLSGSHGPNNVLVHMMKAAIKLAQTLPDMPEDGDPMNWMYPTKWIEDIFRSRYLNEDEWCTRQKLITMEVQTLLQMTAIFRIRDIDAYNILIKLVKDFFELYPKVAKQIPVGTFTGEIGSILREAVKQCADKK